MFEDPLGRHGCLITIFPQLVKLTQRIVYLADADRENHLQCSTDQGTEVAIQDPMAFNSKGKKVISYTNT